VSFFQHPFYPDTPLEPVSDTCVNVPVPAGTRGDAVRQLVTTQWLPALRRHAPQMLFI